ncbi:MAG: PDZ domain-containing protein [Candidatus Scalindua sp.]|nr:PDZ domain-containing protein [Candidatus Scalindua sp.]
MIHMRFYFSLYLFSCLMLFPVFRFDCDVWADDPVFPVKEVTVKDLNFSPEHFFDLREDTFDRNEVDFNKGWLGIFMENHKGKGVRVEVVVDGSPAHVSGLVKGDVITKVNDSELNRDDDGNLVQFKRIMEETGKDTVLSLTIVRNGIEMVVKPRLTAKLVENMNGPVQYQTHPFPASYPFVTDERVKGRSIKEEESFFAFLLQDREFKEKFRKTLQRIGEEAFVRESYHAQNSINLFRLSLIDYLMSHPLNVPSCSEIIHHHLTDRSPLQSFSSAARFLDLAPYVPLQRERSDITCSLQEFAENVLRTIMKSLEVRKTSLNGLTQSDFRFLYDISSRLWMESDNSGAQNIEGFLETATKIDLSMLMKSSLMVLESIPIEQLRRIPTETAKLHPFDLPDSQTVIDNSVKRGNGSVNVSGFGGDVLFIQEVKGIGKVVVGGPKTTWYYDDAAFIIDVGGDDYYLNNAGASRDEASISVCIDLSGNDTYTSRTKFCQGAAQLGTGILLDLGGDDRYMGNEFCQGSGLFGMGFLYDDEGGDSYQADLFCQGCGSFGIGFLRDNNGNDVYLGRMFSQGIGLTKGAGGIIDLKGNDVYFTGAKYPDFRDSERSCRSLGQGFGFGIRPDTVTVGASGGIGVLIDERGNDTYHGDYFAQGSSYYFSFGMLYDKRGCDR